MVSASLITSEDDALVEAFLQQLRSAGYCDRTLRKKRPVAAAFIRWVRRKRIASGALNASHVAGFIGRTPGAPGDRVSLERATVRRFLRYLRGERGVPATRPWMDAPPRIALEQGYESHLRKERGLTERSVCVYTPFAHDFLTWHAAKTSAAHAGRPDGAAVRDFLLERLHGRSASYTRLLAAALRSLLRFLYLRGETPGDLSRAVPPVRLWREAAVHSALSAEDIERVLASTDRSTRRGRRDYAILLLLARLGLRAGEVAALELGDVDWRAAEIVVRGKGRVIARLPLLADVGAALAAYLRRDRERSASRRIFLRSLAPRVGFVGPAAIGGIVRTALARAAVRRAGRGAAHLFRHSLATRMIRQGASLGEIAEVLRHRSQGATEVYAKVAFEALRGVARSWPGVGGAE